MRRPETNEYAPYYEGYIKNVIGNDPLRNLENQFQEIQSLLQSLPEEEANFAYSEGKWTVKEVLGHMIDTERIMGYRALCISRKEKQSLPGFEQDDYVKEANFKQRTISNLLEDYRTVRKSTISLFKNFTENMFNLRGAANGKDVTVLALLYIIAGHEQHHLKILKERYL
ncbi:MAG: DinB family protein [Ignavibacteriaceae bacterium]